ncbi:MAG: sensor histidine kinase [bacterium]
MVLVEDTVDQIRNIMTDLRPPVLDDFGLHAALEWSIARFTERTSIAVEYTGRDLTKRLPLNLEYALFRMAQEALHNVVKHARASHIRVTMKEHRDSVRLTIQDDGIGFDLKKLAEKKEAPGFGLTDIAERMKALGGTFEITSSPGKGTRIILEIKRTAI